MTENRRIFLNVFATYGRSLFGLVCGLLTGRWVLNALGEVDYGLWGVIGCVVTFIAFFNSVLAGANSRFYALAIGRSRNAKGGHAALEECRRWFNTALTIHTVLPIVLMAVGYPIGEWAVWNWLNIPSEKTTICVHAFRFVCLTSFVGMVNVPFTAMYQAKQYIAELTIYSVITTAANVVFGYYMITHPGSWLFKYAVWSCGLSIVPNIIIAWRACCIFPECQIKRSYMWDRSQLREIGVYTAWTAMGRFCTMLRTQGITILINKFFGPTANASMTVANTVNAQTCTLSGALQGAISPAITSAYGAGDYNRFRSLVFTSCKFSTLASLLFILPLSIELPAVLVLWLKNPPSYSVGLCWCMMAYYICDVCTSGHMVAVTATGHLSGYYKFLCSISIFTIPLSVLVSALGFGVYSVGVVLVAMIILNSLGRVFWARRLAMIPARDWLFEIILPVGMIGMICFICGWLVRFVMPVGFLRVCVTTISCLIPFCLLSWKVALKEAERDFVRQKILSKIVRRFNIA